MTDWARWASLKLVLVLKHVDTSRAPSVHLSAWLVYFDVEEDGYTKINALLIVRNFVHQYLFDNGTLNTALFGRRIVKKNTVSFEEGR